MIDTYLLDHMIDTRVINYTKCLQQEESTVEPLRFNDMHGVFYMYLVGTFVSVAGLSAELAYVALEKRFIRGPTVRALQ